MKKIFCSVICLILLSGCKALAVNTVPKLTGIKFTAKIESNVSNSEFNVTVFENGDTELTSLSEELSEISYLFTPSCVTVSYNGLEYKTDSPTLPEYSFTDFVYSVFSTAAKNRPTLYKDGEKYCLSDKNDKYKFTLYFSENGLPLSAEDTENGITLIIKNPEALTE